MMDKPQEWDEAFDKKFFTPEEVEASDARVSAVQKEIGKDKEIGRERVIKGLECCITAGSGCLKNMECPYGAEKHDSHCVDYMLRDALALLKAQEAVEPTWRQGIPFCGKCGRQFGRGFKYCPDCGRAVKWDA